ncbi:hypothetical protein [Streptomyces roseochromogenus]|uniref:Integral membrane protein n=1 Tax=Streptomyces roseochromogenus subsp. oscitans DS 12.976 TaxID=1352936 RepID=V6K950_STRRC|nr:hypothetical protein [Streptomyces roseochromogenus]EST28665.1 hypothetical protein M878_22165 [Streptomyces roseochromogenus subsp. oscitans DS 12.976]
MTAPHPRTECPGAGLRILRAAVFAAVCVALAACGHALASCASVPLWTLGAGFVGCLLLVVPLAGRARSLPGIAALLALGQTALHTLFGLGQHGAAMVSGQMATGSMGSMNPAGSTSSPGATGSLGSSLSDTALVEQAARYLCGSSPGALTPGRAFHVLLAAHLIDRSGRSVTVPGGLSHAYDVTGSSAALLPSLPMLLGHILAAVAAGWLLRRGDLALMRLIELSAHGVAEGALVRSLRAALALACALCAELLPVAGPGPRGRRTAADEPPAPHTGALQHTVIRRGPPTARFLLAA